MRSSGANILTFSDTRWQVLTHSGDNLALDLCHSPLRSVTKTEKYSNSNTLQLCAINILRLTFLTLGNIFLKLLTFPGLFSVFDKFHYYMSVPRDQGSVTTDNNCCITSPHPHNVAAVWPVEIVRAVTKIPAHCECTSVLWPPAWLSIRDGAGGHFVPLRFVPGDMDTVHNGHLPHNTLLSQPTSDSRFSLQIKSHI